MTAGCITMTAVMLEMTEVIVPQTAVILMLTTVIVSLSAVILSQTAVMPMLTKVILSQTTVMLMLTKVILPQTAVVVMQTKVVVSQTTVVVTLTAVVAMQAVVVVPLTAVMAAQPKALGKLTRGRLPLKRILVCCHFGFEPWDNRKIREERKMIKRLCVTLTGALFALSGVAGAQEPLNRSGAAIEKALTNYVRQMEEQRTEPGLPLKAVPRADKAEAVVIGAIAFVDATDFLSDGTPFRIVAVHAKKPFDQDVFVVCLGSSFNNTCGRLAVGRRASFTTDVLVVEDGDSAGLALFVVKKLVQ